MHHQNTALELVAIVGVSTLVVAAINAYAAGLNMLIHPRQTRERFRAWRESRKARRRDSWDRI
jgi:hypothetical protein